MIRTSLNYFLKFKISSGFPFHRLIMGVVHLFSQQTFHSTLVQGLGLQSQATPDANTHSLVRHMENITGEKVLRRVCAGCWAYGGG